MRQDGSSTDTGRRQSLRARRCTRSRFTYMDRPKSRARRTRTRARPVLGAPRAPLTRPMRPAKRLARAGVAAVPQQQIDKEEIHAILLALLPELTHSREHGREGVARVK